MTCISPAASIARMYRTCDVSASLPSASAAAAAAAAAWQYAAQTMEHRSLGCPALMQARTDILGRC